MMSDATVNRAYLALGSNIDPAKNIPAAVGELSKYGRVTAVSGVWESPPVGFLDQPNFFNAAVLLLSSCSANELCQVVIPQIENALGRVRDPNNKNAPRTIDIDLVLFNDEILQIEHRQIPDPEIMSRPFLAIPLAEIDAEHVHPTTGQSLSEIANTFNETETGLKARQDIVLRPTA